MRGKKTGGRKPGSKNKATLAMEAAAAAAVGGDAHPRAAPTLSKIMKYFLDRAEAEASKAGGGDAKVVCELHERTSLRPKISPCRSGTTAWLIMIPRVSPTNALTKQRRVEMRSVRPVTRKGPICRGLRYGCRPCIELPVPSSVERLFSYCCLFF
jgi:hypothetical protein